MDEPADPGAAASAAEPRPGEEGDAPAPDEMGRELQQLNRSHGYDMLAPIESHRRLGGGIVVTLKRRLRPFLYGTLLPAFEGQQSFNRALVRFSNATKERIDRLEDALGAIERARTGVLERIEDLDVKLESYMTVLARRMERLEEAARPESGAAPPSRERPPGGRGA